MFSDHNEIKLEINNRGIFGKLTNMWKLRNMAGGIAQEVDQSKPEFRPSAT
jgi:hypothetical protein